MHRPRFYFPITLTVPITTDGIAAWGSPRHGALGPWLIARPFLGTALTSTPQRGVMQCLQIPVEAAPGTQSLSLDVARLMRTLAGMTTGAICG